MIFSHVKCADNTTLLTSVINPANRNARISAVNATQRWSEDNNMLLNTNKTVIMNTCLSNKFNYDSNISCNGSVLQPNLSVKILSVSIVSKFCKSN